jgi:hypothetical protein
VERYLRDSYDEFFGACQKQEKAEMKFEGNPAEKLPAFKADIKLR